MRRRLAGERSERLSGVRSHVGLEKWLDFIPGVIGLSLQYLIYFLKESFRQLSGKHTEGKARAKFPGGKGIIIIVRAENENCLYFVMG